MPPIMASTLLVMSASVLPAAAQSLGPLVSDSEYSVFWTPYWGQIDQKATDGGLASTTTINSQSLSVTRRIRDGFSLGFDLTYEDQTVETDTRLPGFAKPARLDTESLEVKLKSSWTYGLLTFDPQVRFGVDDYELDRPDTLTYSMANAKTDGYHVGGYFEVSSVLPIVGNLFLRPTASFDYEYTHADSFTETGNGLGSLSYDKIGDERAIGEIGLGLAALFEFGENSTFAPFVNAKYRRNLLTGPIETEARSAYGFGDLGTVAIATTQEKQGMLLDAGAIMTINNQMELWALYRGQYFPNSTRHGFAGRLAVNF